MWSKHGPQTSLSEQNWIWVPCPASWYPLDIWSVPEQPWHDHAQKQDGGQFYHPVEKDYDDIINLWSTSIYTMLCVLILTWSPIISRCTASASPDCAALWSGVLPTYILWNVNWTTALPCDTYSFWGCVLCVRMCVWVQCSLGYLVFPFQCLEG